MVAGWSQAFAALQERGRITGFVLVMGNGHAPPVTGPFVEDCTHGSVSPQLQLLVEAFAMPEVPTSFYYRGAKLITLHRGDSCYLAVSTHTNTDGIVAVKAPGGVLLASFNRPTLPTIALTAVQVACEAAFKRKRHPGDHHHDDEVQDR